MEIVRQSDATYSSEAGCRLHMSPGSGYGKPSAGTRMPFYGNLAFFAELQLDRAAAIVGAAFATWRLKRVPNEEKPNCMELCRQLVLCSFGLVITSSVTCGAHHLQ